MFDALDKVEELLKGKDYLVGDRLTEADVRLFVTIVSPELLVCVYLAEAGPQVRFDPVYHGHYKCNFRTIRDGYPAIDLYALSIFFWPILVSEVGHSLGG